MEWMGSLAGFTDVGESRDHNEDGLLLQDLGGGREIPTQLTSSSFQDGLLLAVSDGMGGASAGETASSITLEALREHGRNARERVFSGDGAEGLELWLAEGIHLANRRVLEAGIEDPSLAGMGATATAALVFGGTLFLAHVGDSRAYLLRAGSLLQLTSDHTLVGQMVARGDLSPDEAREHDQRHMLLQAVGTQERLDVETTFFDLEAGDRLLLCSDGLYDLVRDEGIAQTLSDDGDPEAQCKALVTAANSLGGFDNITVVILHLG